MTFRLKTQTVACLTAVVLAAVLSGCTGPITPGTQSVSEIESNDSFATAQSVTVSQDQPITLIGSLSGSDVDVFSLGSYSSGQTVTVDLAGGSALSSNTIELALFDQDQNIALGDENSVSPGFNLTISLIVRKAGVYYLTISQAERNSFSYTAQVTIGTSEVPVPKNQLVFLNYKGVSSVDIGGEHFTNVLPFSAVSPTIDATTAAARITNLIRKDYQGYGIQIVSSYDTLEPTDPHSVVFVSGSSGDYYGLADQVDWYNHDPTDRAIIFAGLLYDMNVTLDQFVIGTANVTSHELGHLVGLVHTDDHTELMDQTTPVSLLVVDQTFHRSILAEYPIGWEDTLQLLGFSLGSISP